MIKFNGLLQNKLERNLKCLIQHCEDGLMRVKWSTLLQYQTIDYTIFNQSLNYLTNQMNQILKTKEIMENPTVIAVCHHLNNQMICSDKLNLCKPNFQIMKLSQILVQVLIGKEVALGKWFLNPLMEKLRELLLHTEIDCVGSVLKCWNLSLENVKSNSWFSIKTNNIQNHQNWQKIYFPLSTFSIVDKWEKEDIKRKIQKILMPMEKKQNKKIQKKKQPKKEKNPKKIKKVSKNTEDIPNNKIKISKKENKRNYKKKEVKKKEKTSLEIFNEKMKETNETYITKKIRIYPTKEQKHLLRKWIGTYRFIYNFTKNVIIKDKNPRNFMMLRDAIVSKENNIIMKDFQWTFETPKEIRAGAIRELITNLNDREDIKYKSKKEKTQTIKVPKTAYKKKGNKLFLYPTYLNEIKIESTPKNLRHVPDDAVCDLLLTYSRPNIWHVLIPVKKEIKEFKKEAHNIGAFDLNLRNVMSGVGIDGKTFKIGEKCYDKIKEHYELMDKLKSKLSSLKKERNRLEYLKTKNILGLQEFKVKNLINELHNKTIKLLVDNYDIIIYPPLRIQEIVNKNKKFNRKAYSIGHYKLMKKLEQKCHLLGKKLVKTTEEYTTKTCSCCGFINFNMAEEEIYKCPKCSKIMDRDINSAKNILFKTLTKTVV